MKPKDLPVQGVLSGCPHSLSWESDWNSRGSKRDSINKATARKHAPSSAQMMESVVSMQTVPAGGVCGHLLPHPPVGKLDCLKRKAVLSLPKA